MSEYARLDTPRTSRGPAFNFDPEAVGRISEAIARFLGTGRYLLWQTILGAWPAADRSRDLRLQVSIGIYDFELEKPQAVVINVDLLLETGMISPGDEQLFHYVETAEEAWAKIAEFYELD